MPRRHRKKAPPQGLFDAEISALSHDGRGIARLDGKIIFIDGALPGEKVKFEYSFQRKQFDEGIAREIFNPSYDRVKPPCDFAGLCGGCSLQHMSSAKQISFKQAAFVEQFQHIAEVEIPKLLEPLASPTLNYRRKARLAVKYVPAKGKVLLGFREKRNSYIADIENCEILVKEIGHKLRLLANMIEGLQGRSVIPQVEVAKGDDSVVALIFRHLEPLSDADLGTMKLFCSENNFHLYVQPKGPESVERIALKNAEEQADMRLHYALPDYDIKFAFHPCDFTQVNGDINRLMIKRVMELLAPCADDIILDLFCGLGNFSLPMAKSCQRLVGVEGSELMVQRAKENAALNQLTNCEFYSLNLEQDLSDLKKDASSWVNIPFNKMLIDPPRSGAQAVVEKIHLFKELKTIVYVSCNPATLARDTGILIKQGFKLQAAGVMDMFPHTNHVESLALFTRA